MKLQRQAHVVYKTQYHVLWVTRYRRKILVKGIAEYFKKKIYWDNGGIWARGFFVSTVGINEAVIRKYVRYQGQQDAGQTKFEW